MNILKVKNDPNIPKNFTGIAEFPDGSKEWYKDGKLHREDGPACEYSNGTKHWYKEGKCHREDGPSIECLDGPNFWYKDGELHREDGPACEFPDGSKYWHLNGVEYSEINLNDYVILDFYQGSYNLMWYKLLTKDKIFEHPDIPGLIEK